MQIYEGTGLPVSVDWVESVARADCGSHVPIVLAGEAVPAGFPSPAEEYFEKTLDLNEHLVPRPEATFFVRVCGDSMIGAAIHHDDLLVVDRSRTPRSGDVIIACVDGEFTVKRLRKTATGLELAPENPEYPPVPLSEDTDFQVWGVVQHVIHKL
ncbi:umuD protein [Pseudodesulfovibrio nedwellii]|uniref:UmuD protein n=1 Tax=Pseudodesulfovibrio nedwellii TaxID=2973072 RepID=A0ABN6S3D8_9BACT|nr:MULTISPECIES: translesion error-prone DNA polymerase V autoproteolytic subunit [Pseudodesulfovibrio]BDQ37751.1 umuD protein [Pseudodesulfovibrio nedwellii]